LAKTEVSSSFACGHWIVLNFLVVHQLENYKDQWDPSMLFKERHPFLHKNNHVCWMVPVGWTHSPCENIKDMTNADICTLKPLYITFEGAVSEQHFGIRVLTSHMTKNRILEALYGWDRIGGSKSQLSITQPQIQPSLDLDHHPYIPISNYYRVIWLFLSSKYTSNLSRWSFFKNALSGNGSIIQFDAFTTKSPRS
jgi:hypothetical protein